MYIRLPSSRKRIPILTNIWHCISDSIPNRLRLFSVHLCGVYEILNNENVLEEKELVSCVKRSNSEIRLTTNAFFWVVRKLCRNPAPLTNDVALSYLLNEIWNASPSRIFHFHIYREWSTADLKHLLCSKISQESKTDMPIFYFLTYFLMSSRFEMLSEVPDMIYLPCGIVCSTMRLERSSMETSVMSSFALNAWEEKRERSHTGMCRWVLCYVSILLFHE